MCLITEHAHALKRIKELEAELANLKVGEFYLNYQPSSTEHIEYSELFLLLHNLFPRAVINLGEYHRFLCGYDDIAVFLAQDQTNKMDYVPDTKELSSYDCNVFANRLLGQFSVPGWADLTFGKIWLSSPAHALNCMVSVDRKFFFVEPQTDELLPKEHYLAESARFIEM